MRILSVFGTRPEAIKMARVVNALQNTPGFDPVVCVTAQHRQMLDQVLDLFEIHPDYDLNLMQAGQGLGDTTAGTLRKLAPVLREAAPELVLVQGDTTTTFAAALAAFYQHVPVAHVEAGLRTGNIYAPWPEEINRRLTSTIASTHFPPTPRARDNLLREGVDAATIHVTGNTVIDALLEAVDKTRSDDALRQRLESRVRFLEPEAAHHSGDRASARGISARVSTISAKRC